MACTPEPNYYGRQLIRELKDLRERAGLTQQETGDRLNLTLQKLSRIENGQIPGYHELRAMLDLYGLSIDDWQEYLDLWNLAKTPAWWRPYRIKDPRCLRMENEAATKWEYQLGAVPTLLQTEQYMRAELAGSEIAGGGIENQVAVRMRLQERLYGDQRLTFHALVHEAVLRHGIDQDQAQLIVDRASLPNVTFQVVPGADRFHDGVRGSVILLSFDDPREPDIAFTDTLLGLVQAEDQDRVTAVRRVLKRLTSLALSPEDSLSLLTGQFA